jgi:hypothetical protein
MVDMKYVHKKLIGSQQSSSSGQPGQSGFEKSGEMNNQNL